jgi:hypothetical protein
MTDDLLRLEVHDSSPYRPWVLVILTVLRQITSRGEERGVCT